MAEWERRLLVCFQVREFGGMEDAQAECHAQGWMDGWMGGSTLAWLPEKGTHATLPGKELSRDVTDARTQQCRGEAEHIHLFPTADSSVSTQHSCLKPNKITAILEKRIRNIQE